MLSSSPLPGAGHTVDGFGGDLRHAISDGLPL